MAEVPTNSLEQRLNEIEEAGFVIFNIVPTLTFEKTRVAMVGVSLPKEILMNIICYKESAIASD